MAFRIRGRNGEPRWAGGTLRERDGAYAGTCGPDEIEFAGGRRWTSPRTGIAYPVQWHVRRGITRVRPRAADG